MMKVILSSLYGPLIIQGNLPQGSSHGTVERVTLVMARTVLALSNGMPWNINDR